MSFSIFEDAEEEYLDWISNNSDGFVLTTVRGIATNYMSLHTAKCRMISQRQKNMHPDAFTGQGYIKICSNDTDELLKWIRSKGGNGFTKLCSKCKPLIVNGVVDQARELEVEFESAVKKAMASSPSARQSRLATAPKMPESIVVMTKIFRRNPDVVADVLCRAKGKCEACNTAAPFTRSSDGTPYLEVHHRKPLSQGGEDTVDNAIALCPNCHRKSHYGM